MNYSNQTTLIKSIITLVNLNTTKSIKTAASIAHTLSENNCDPLLQFEYGYNKVEYSHEYIEGTWFINIIVTKNNVIQHIHVSVDEIKISKTINTKS